MEWNEKQKHILYVAEALFGAKGYEGTSVRDIAQAAEVNLAMISYYFGSKEKLLQSLIRLRMEQSSLILEGLNKNRDISPVDKIDAIIDFFVDKRLNNRDFYTIVSRQLSLVNTGELVQILIEFKRRNSDMITDIINEGIKEGVFRKVNNELTISTVIGTISQVYMSRPFYCSLLNIDQEDEETYFKIIAPKLKKHLKELLHAHLKI